MTMSLSFLREEPLHVCVKINLIHLSRTCEKDISINNSLDCMDTFFSDSQLTPVKIMDLIVEWLKFCLRKI